MTNSTPIRIGEINTYSPSALSGFMQKYRQGIDLCLEEINRAGGLLGRPLEVVFRDDELSSEKAATQAERLLLDDKVDLIAGTFTSDVGLAVARVADRLKRVFVATEPRTDLLVWDQGSRYVFRIRTSQYMMASMLVSHAAATLPRRCSTISPDYAGAKRMAEMARSLLAKTRADMVFAEHQSFKLGEIDEGVMDRLVATEPEVIFSVVYGSDLLPFVRMGRERGLFDNTVVLSPLADPEYLLTVGDELPAGWIVLGYPGEADQRPEHLQFFNAYRDRFTSEPDAAALIGYMSFQAIGAAVRRAGSLETEAMIAALRGLCFDSPIGPVTVRAGDHQATVGNWIGYTAVRDGQPVVEHCRFLDGAEFLPSEAEASVMRPTASRS
jgi:branched-chain amino acid transport system substrate-binding protein